MLLEAGVPVGASDDRGYAAIHYAAVLSCAPLVRCLAAHGADMNVAVVGHGQVEAGLFPLHLACAKCALEVVAALLDCGASTNPGGYSGVMPPLLAALGMASGPEGRPWRSARGRALAVRLVPEGALPDAFVERSLSDLGPVDREAVRQLALVAARQTPGQQLGDEELRRVAVLLCVAVLMAPEEEGGG